MSRIITTIEFPCNGERKRIEVSDEFLFQIEKLLKLRGLTSFDGFEAIVTGYDRIRNLGKQADIFEYADEWYSGEGCLFALVSNSSGELTKFILCNDEQTAAILRVVSNRFV